ncbi:MAG: ParB N-terminal domain-containing protein [Dehalococcoidales bacterium]|nr:ParB N-terminal domain-containing protein [Dehalococcoidales bacterium]
MKKKAIVSNIAEPLRSLAVPIESLTPDPRNARLHPDINISTIKYSLEAYGQRKPIVVRKSTMTVEAGNGMLEAAKTLGWTEVAAVMVDDDDVMAKGFGLMDNKSALSAEWDMPALKDLLEELDASNFDMTLTGFAIKEIEGLMTQFHIDEPGAQDEGANQEKVNKCPHCGYEW